MSSHTVTVRPAGASPRVRRSLVPGLAFMVVMLILCAMVSADEMGGRVVVQGAEASGPVVPVVLEGSLLDLPTVDQWRPGDAEHESPREPYPASVTLATGSAPARRTDADLLDGIERSAVPASTKEFGSSVVSFPGRSFTGVRPPDPVGDVGPWYYIQAVQGVSAAAEFTVYNKLGYVVAGPVRMDSIPPSGNCRGAGTGCPMVLYDEAADRWVMAEAAYQSETVTNLLCVYVSMSGNPVSDGWYVYDFPQANFPFFPQLAVWPDAYYLTTSEGTNPPIYAFQRSAMLTGDPATQQRFTVSDLPGYGYQELTPVDLDGDTAPPAGAPGIVMRHNDDEAHSGSPDPTKDFLDIFTVDIDWDVPGNSTVTLSQLEINEYNSWLIDYTTTSSIPQPGTTQRLDSMRELIMHRLAYRNMDGYGYESIVGNFVTNQYAATSGSDVSAAVRWFELRRSGSKGPWSAVQQGTANGTGDLSENRWIGAIAQDQGGNIALGYSFDHASAFYPSLFYSGHSAGAAPGVLDTAEYYSVLGSSSQTASPAWGCYGSMSVDPVDDCTFWLTGEYMGVGGEWATQVEAFNFENPSAVDVVPNGPLNVCANQAVTLTANTTGGSRLNHEWYEDGAPMGAGGTSVDVSNPAGYHWYNCEVRGASCNYGVMDAQGTEITWQDPPFFAGLRWVTAQSAIGCGLRLEWEAAMPCHGSSVVYNVYRSPTPSFTPSPANLIASCVSTTWYDDTTVLANTNYYYIVRAEDSTVGNGGPCNGGFEDPNGVERSAIWSDDVDSYSGISDAEAAGWTHGAAAGSDDWRIEAYYSTRAFMATTENTTADKYLVTPWLRIGPTAELRFYHVYTFELNYDGGVLEIDTGTGWQQIPNSAIAAPNGYDAMLIGAGPLAGMWAWTGAGEWVEVVVDLSAYARATARIRWRMGCDGSLGGGYDWVIDNIVLSNVAAQGCSDLPEPLPFHTGRAVSTQVTLEWINPSNLDWDHTLICWSIAGFITDAEDCVPPNLVECDGDGCGGELTGPGQHDMFIHEGLEDDIIYYYSGFGVTGDFNAYHYSAVNSFMAFPSAAISPTHIVKWGFHTGASALTPPGLGSLFALTNTKGIFSLSWGPDGGAWITGSSPLAMTGPVQARPPVINLTTPIGGATKVVFVGVSDGTVLAMDGDTGEEIWTSADFGTFTAAPAGVFADLGGSFNLVLIGTRNAGADNAIVALDPYNVTTPNPAVWQWDNGGGIGIISGTATWVNDQGNYKLYFASRERDGSNQGTLWCIEFGVSLSDVALCSGAWPLELGNIDSSPLVRNGFVYVGTNAGRVYKINAESGAYGWSPTYYDTGDGAIKGYVSPDLGSTALYLATTNTVWGLLDDGNSATLDWSVATIPSPSVPLFAPNSSFVYVGGGDGRLYQIEVTGPTTTYIALGLAAATSSAVGSPALDVANDMVYVGTEAGALYSLDVPF